MRATLPLAAIALLASAAPAAAQVASGARSVFSYTWLEVEYFQVDFDAFEDDLSGFGLSGSIELAGNLHLVAGYGSGDIDVLGTNVDTDEFSAGLGFHAALDERVDGFAEARYINSEITVDAIDLSDSEDGYGLGAGIRFLAADRLEVFGRLDYIDLVDGSTTFTGGARFYPTPNVGLGVRYSLNDDADTLGIGLRFQR